jgi:acyl-CoA synthetase (AMP-forming)/AMP-acid ligase II
MMANGTATGIAATSTFSDILKVRASEQGGKQAFVFLKSHGSIEDQLTFSDLDQRARDVAVKLIINDLCGERVLLVFPPGLDFVVALFACFYANAVAVPVPFYSGKRVVERINSICRDADPAGVLTVTRLGKELQVRESVLSKTSGFVWIEIDALDAEHDLPDVPLPTTDPNALALLQYTSGSTTAPKGVMITHANLIANNTMIAEVFGHNSNSRGVGWLPLFHDMGLVGHVLQPVYFGGLSVLMSPLAFLQKPIRWLRAISDWNATTSGGPSHAFEHCLRLVRNEELSNIDLSSWEVAYCGSEKIRTDVLDKFTRRFAAYGFREKSFLPCYGLAEATLLVTGTRGETNIDSARPADAIYQFPTASCGAQAPNTTLNIVEPGIKTKVESGSVGEIWVQGPQVAQGYWGAAGSENQECFHAHLADGAGPYLRTGDLGFVKDEKLYVVGRIKNTIIVNGVKHAAEDIEACMRSHHFFAGSVGAAFAIDSNGREQAVLVQEVTRGRSDSDDLVEALKLGYASITRQLGIRLFDLVLVRAGALARTSSGKVRRAHAREKYLREGFERLAQPKIPLPEFEAVF